MNIQDTWLKIKAFAREHKQQLYLLALFILAVMLAFSLGRLSVLYGGASDFKVEYSNDSVGH